jgi:hypothetical protein
MFINFKNAYKFFVTIRMSQKHKLWIELKFLKDKMNNPTMGVPFCMHLISKFQNIGFNSSIIVIKFINKNNNKLQDKRPYTSLVREPYIHRNPCMFDFTFLMWQKGLKVDKMILYFNYIIL